jgi:hypothetical protein
MKTLLEKLNYKGQKRIVVMNADKDFPLASGDELKDVQVDTDIDPRYPYEFMMIFVRKISEVRNTAPVALHNLTDNGVLWFCYKKKSSKKGSSDLDRDHGWKPLNDMDFYGMRMVSVNEEWSALRFRNIKYIRATSAMFPKKDQRP